MDLVTKIFPADSDIQHLIAAEKAQEEKAKASEVRWYAGMPRSIRPMWGKTSEEFLLLMKLSSTDLNQLLQALAQEFPQGSDQILALLTWYGSGEGPWSGFPAYEDIPQQLLMEFSTAEILAAIESTSMSDTQLEGAARFFGGWELSVRRPDKLKALPESLKRTLLEHSLGSTDEDKRTRAKRAFSAQ